VADGYREQLIPMELIQFTFPADAARTQEG
jgi:hypothetical protein